jgi:NAD(P)-dependent dehydrogenase (short-subunit alcohol dehydrogenase family)
VVTGAASGIGRACAVRLAADGAAVACLDLNEEGLRNLAAEVGGTSAGIGTYLCDVSQEQAVREVVERAVLELGPPTILVNSAAALTAEVLGRDQDLREFATDVFDATMSVNVRSQMLLAKYTVPHMITAGEGAVVNIASIAAFGQTGGNPCYTASKAAIVALTRSIAHQYGRYGIRANSVLPGFTLTPAAMRLPEEVRARALDVHLLRRVGKPEDMAAAVAFLVDETQSGFITAQHLTVDGGWSARMPDFRAGGGRS